MVKLPRSELPGRPTWGVVTTVREQRNLLFAFVSYYKSVGADYIYVYLDKDDPQTRTQIENVPGCQVVVADQAYFRSEWECDRPELHRRRQRLNATHAYRYCTVNWLLHVDADEYLICNNFSDFLARSPKEIDTIQILNGERIFQKLDARDTVFSGWMLRPGGLKRWQMNSLFGAEVRRFTDHGFCGHRLGKSVTRTGRDFRLGIHTPQKRHDFNQATSSDPVLCHFDGLTALHWMLKLLRYKDAGLNIVRNKQSPFRYEQIRYLQAEKNARQAAEHLHDMVRVYEGDVLKTLYDRGIAAPIELDVVKAVETVFPELSIDLSPEYFDQNLQNQMPHQYAQLT